MQVQGGMLLEAGFFLQFLIRRVAYRKNGDQRVTRRPKIGRLALALKPISL